MRTATACDAHTGWAPPTVSTGHTACVSATVCAGYTAREPATWCVALTERAQAAVCTAHTVGVPATVCAGHTAWEPATWCTASAAVCTERIAWAQAVLYTVLQRGHTQHFAQHVQRFELQVQRAYQEQNDRFHVHDGILCRVEKVPVKKERQAGVGLTHVGPRQLLQPPQQRPSAPSPAPDSDSSGLHGCGSQLRPEQGLCEVRSRALPRCILSVSMV